MDYTSLLGSEPPSHSAVVVQRFKASVVEARRAAGDARESLAHAYRTLREARAALEAAELLRAAHASAFRVSSRTTPSDVVISTTSDGSGNTT